MTSTERTVGAQTDDPRYWRRRAQETHSLAEQMHNVSARGIMLDIALRYEAMAKTSELRLGAGVTRRKSD